MKLKTTIAGSLPKPSWLAEPEKLWGEWKLKDSELFNGQCEAALNWIKFQENSGVDIISDGEQFRKHFVHGFLELIHGIDWNKMTTMGIRNDRYDAEVPTVVSKLKRLNSIHAKSTEYCLKNTSNDFKITLPGPMTICDTIANGFYSSRKEMAYEFAKILNAEALELEKLGVHTIQFDEPAFNAFTKEASEWGVEILEVAASGLKCKTAVHICYGYGIKQNIDWKKTLGNEWKQYEDFFPTLNDSSIDQVSLECANSRVPLEVLKMLNSKEILVGVIDVASLKIETPEEVFKILNDVSKYVDYKKIIACTNCGMAPMPYNIAEKKIKSLVAGANLFSKSYN